MNIVDGTELIYLPAATRTKRCANRDGGMLLTESGTVDEKRFIKTRFFKNNSATNLSRTCFVKDQSNMLTSIIKIILHTYLIPNSIFTYYTKIKNY